jgi:hypothetical protein
MTHQLDAFKLIISRIPPHGLNGITPYQGHSRSTVIITDLGIGKLVTRVTDARRQYIVNRDPNPYIEVLIEFKNALDEYFVWYIYTSPEHAAFDNVAEQKYPEIVNEIAQLQLKSAKAAPAPALEPTTHTKADTAYVKMKKTGHPYEGDKECVKFVNAQKTVKHPYVNDDSIASRVRDRRRKSTL